jgi:N6-L-threonylcarbamoyladenine synthase
MRGGIDRDGEINLQNTAIRLDDRFRADMAAAFQAAVADVLADRLRHACDYLALHAPVTGWVMAGGVVEATSGLRAAGEVPVRKATGVKGPSSRGEPPAAR